MLAPPSDLCMESLVENRYRVEEKGSGTENNRSLGLMPSSPLLIGNRLLHREMATVPYHTYAQEERDTEQDDHFIADGAAHGKEREQRPSECSPGTRYGTFSRCCFWGWHG